MDETEEREPEMPEAASADEAGSTPAEGPGEEGQALEAGILAAAEAATEDAEEAAGSADDWFEAAAAESGSGPKAAESPDDWFDAASGPAEPASGPSPADKKMAALLEAHALRVELLAKALNGYGIDAYPTGVATGPTDMADRILKATEVPEGKRSAPKGTASFKAALLEDLIERGDILASALEEYSTKRNPSGEARTTTRHADRALAATGTARKPTSRWIAPPGSRSRR